MGKFPKLSFAIRFYFDESNLRTLIGDNSYFTLPDGELLIPLDDQLDSFGRVEFLFLLDLHSKS